MMPQHSASGAPILALSLAPWLLWAPPGANADASPLETAAFCADQGWGAGGAEPLDCGGDISVGLVLCPEDDLQPGFVNYNEGSNYSGEPTCIYRAYCVPQPPAFDDECDTLMQSVDENSQPYEDMNIPVKSFSVWIQANGNFNDVEISMYSDIYCGGYPIEGDQSWIGNFQAMEDCAGGEYYTLQEPATIASLYVGTVGDHGQDGDPYAPPDYGEDYYGVKVVMCPLPNMKPQDEFDPYDDANGVGALYGTDISCVDRKYCLPFDPSAGPVVDSWGDMDFAGNKQVPIDFGTTVDDGTGEFHAEYPAQSIWIDSFFNRALSCGDASIWQDQIFKYPPDGCCAKATFWEEVCEDVTAGNAGDPAAILVMANDAGFQQEDIQATVRCVITETACGDDCGF